MVFRALRNGFACLLSKWESAMIQSPDEYEVRCFVFEHCLAKSNWQVFRVGIVALFANHKEYVRAAYAPALHFYAVHSGVFSASRADSCRGRASAFRKSARTRLHAFLAKVVRRYWHLRGSLATGGLERHGKDLKLEFLAGTARTQWNRYGTHGYVSLLRRRNVDWALELRTD